jgi:anionic cell wall polymer biosynthesis LytR-Cps2A-Psr (LCP) family protein
MNGAKKRQMPPLRRTVAVVVLLLLLGLIVTGLVVFQNFSSQVTGSNHRVPHATRVILPKRRSIRSQPQLLLVRFDQASLFVRTNPSRHLVSILSVPSSAYAMNEGKRETIANAFASGGTAALIRFMRSALGLTTTHVAVVEPNEVAPLVDAVGGVEIRDPSYALASGRGRGGEIAFDGPDARRYLESAEGTLRRNRERAVLEAAVARLMSASGLSTMTRLAREFPKIVATDMSPQDAAALAFLRLRLKRLVECGAEGGSSLVSPASHRELQQFLGRAPAQAQNGRVLPESGCRASQVASAGVPAAIVSVASATLSIFPLLPAIAIGVVALDLLMLLLLLRVPHLLVGLGRVVGPALVGAGIGRLGYGHVSAAAGTLASGGRHRRSRLRPRRRAAPARQAPSRTANAPLDQSPAEHPAETRSPQRLDPAPLVAHRHTRRRRTRSRSRLLARAARVRFSRALSPRDSPTAYRPTPVRLSGEPAEKTRRRHPLHRSHRLARKTRWRLHRIAVRANWALGVVALSALIGYLATKL